MWKEKSHLSRSKEYTQEYTQGEHGRTNQTQWNLPSGRTKWEGVGNPFVDPQISSNLQNHWFRKQDQKHSTQFPKSKRIQLRTLSNSPNIFLQISKYENMQLPKYLLTDHQICKYAVLQISSYRWLLQLLQAQIRGLGWGWWVDFKLWYLYCELFPLISSFHICISDLIFSSDIFNADLSNYFPLLKLFLLLTWFWAQIFPLLT